jgi:hypothetical protein
MASFSKVWIALIWPKGTLSSRILVPYCDLAPMQILTAAEPLKIAHSESRLCSCNFEGVSGMLGGTICSSGSQCLVALSLVPFPLVAILGATPTATVKSTHFSFSIDQLD